MRKLKMPKQELNNFEDVFHIFEASQNAKGVSETTLNNYKYNLKNISKYLDVKKPFDDVTKSDVEQMVVAMRKAGLAHNTIATYNRMLKTFYNWCNAEELVIIHSRMRRKVPKIIDMFNHCIGLIGKKLSSFPNRLNQVPFARRVAFLFSFFVYILQYFLCFLIVVNITQFFEF